MGTMSCKFIYLLGITLSKLSVWNWILHQQLNPYFFSVCKVYTMIYSVDLYLAFSTIDNRSSFGIWRGWFNLPVTNIPSMVFEDTYNSVLASSYMGTCRCLYGTFKAILFLISFLIIRVCTSLRLYLQDYWCLFSNWLISHSLFSSGIFNSSRIIFLFYEKFSHDR